MKKYENIRGPSLFDFFKDATRFPAFHFYDLMKSYGDVVKCGPFFYLINHPDIAKDILNRDQKDFSQKDFIGKRVTALFGYGMVTSQGELWSSQRRLLNPVFSYKSLHENMEEAIAQIDMVLDSLETSATKNEKIDLAEVMGSLAILTSGKLLFHYDLSNYVNDIKDIVKTGTAYIAKGLPFYLPLWVPSPTHIKLKQIGKRIDAILNQIIESRQSDRVENDDMAQTLIRSLGGKGSSQYKRRVMLDEMKTMLAGGYFPVSCSLSMIWYALGENKRDYEKMIDEIQSKPTNYKFSNSFYQDFPVTTSVIFEAIRLYPVAFSIWRKAKVDFETHGIIIPKGKSICISLFNIHRHPELWENPDHFRSERFKLTVENERPKHYFMPFGWGNRKCIGDHYAIMLIFLTLIRTLQRFDVKIYHESLKVRRAALICPKHVYAELSLIS